MKHLSDSSASTSMTESPVPKTPSSTSFVSRGNDTEYGVSTVSEIKAFVECCDNVVERSNDCDGRYLCVGHRRRPRPFCHLIFGVAVKTTASKCNAMSRGRSTQGARWQVLLIWRSACASTFAVIIMPSPRRAKEPRTHGVEATVVTVLQERARVASVQYSLDVLAR
ncbi:hypothetical protein HPB50_009835 [Hyalomma asiaticum]|uniref:Uncharacterized protein n=1 Tax=Hyalomma asiaticum TaxID=266040 RepID=A0ACB7TI10_HYAAI|nr:hypothetical protein HPB50_009835 [Hyalomma asiaticum]